MTCRYSIIGCTCQAATSQPGNRQSETDPCGSRPKSVGIGGCRHHLRRRDLSGCERRREWIGAARQGRRNRPDGSRPRRGILFQTSSNHFLERWIYVSLDGRTRQNFSIALCEPPLLKGASSETRACR